MKLSLLSLLSGVYLELKGSKDLMDVLGYLCDLVWFIFLFQLFLMEIMSHLRFPKEVTHF